MYWEAYDTSPELADENEQPHQTWLYGRESNDVVDEKMEPTDFEVWAYIYAVESYRDYERYGLPYEGGSMAQPWVWKLALDCVNDAIAAATTEARAVAKHNRKS